MSSPKLNWNFEAGFRFEEDASELKSELKASEDASELKASEDFAQGNSESKNDKTSKSDNAKPKLVLTLAEWAARDLPKPDFIMGNWLTTTSRVFAFADTGLGKTMLAMAIGMAAAAGKDFLHWRGVRPAKVLYIDGEIHRRLFKRRLADEALRLGVAPETSLRSVVKTCQTCSR